MHFLDHPIKSAYCGATFSSNGCSVCRAVATTCDIFGVLATNLSLRGAQQGHQIISNSYKIICFISIRRRLVLSFIFVPMSRSIIATVWITNRWAPLFMCVLSSTIQHIIQIDSIRNGNKQQPNI